MRTRLARLLTVVLLAVAGMAYGGAVPAQAEAVEVTVSLYRVQELSCNEGDFEACGNDYYPKFKIGDNELYDGKDDFCCAHGSDFTTNWVHKATVDTSRNPVDIRLELWDQDDLSDDDVIHWVRTGDYLDLKFDLFTCVFTGGGLTVQQGANLPTLAGESETTGADTARGYFTISTPDCVRKVNETDSDGDGIMNGWETPKGGLDVNTDGRIDLALGQAPFNALPYRKDLFVEADFMQGFRPVDGALQDVIDAFAAAPVDPFPEPTSQTFRGVKLHAAVDEQVPHVAGINFRSEPAGDRNDFYDFKRGNPRGPCTGFFGTAADRADANCEHILNARRQVFRYALFADTFAENTSSSGSAEWAAAGPQGGNDFIVTMGALSDTTFERAGGRRATEAATFMHELGHTLSLGHGGDDATNCKPNYLSVMNYNLQFPIRDSARPLDYSSAHEGTALTTPLDEAHLNENRGVYGNPRPERNIVFGRGGKLEVAPATDGRIDWNGMNGDKEPDVAADINDIDSIRACRDASPNEVLDGFDDWANIQYNPRLFTGSFADGTGRETVEEMTEQTVLEMSQKADLKVTKSADKQEAAGGDTVSYTVPVTNLGPGAAKEVSLTDTLPDGTEVRRPVPDLASGATDTQTFGYEVPCDTADGTVLTNTVAVTGKDADGVVDPYTSDNTAKATTTVRAPVLTAGLTATASVNAGEAITYTIGYANTGGGPASAVTITATLPAGVYYSQALDQGAGPKPGTVTRNADGTTTLTWSAGDLPARSGERSIVLTARPTLLATAGTAYAASVSAGFKNAGQACTFEPVSATARTTVTEVRPTRNPVLPAVWALRPDLRTAEVLARVQATDTRFDGADDSAPDGALSQREASATLTLPVLQPRTLRAELLAATLNLGTRRINAATAVDTLTTRALGLSTVGDAVRYAQATLAEPPTAANLVRYTKTTLVLTEINSGLAERW
ncbi:DUF7507 domain-containing protein [Nonomuraea gerenzanensis]|uniref:Conserved repeat domain protein n=1 Tax=Nonomuraea gerenzanensis TaxID=93944 RepID=A0A1M4DY10_9ACTN|nr:CARDB domain-containing protein [Nonomuraea gerenzanensis]UBU13753.1 DUF11 domain-containing protein [Nonomuraea gerenzanensis]SBO91422.1 conserved repeat domain protein [Nonomuraea gerenzanensis]